MTNKLFSLTISIGILFISCNSNDVVYEKLLNKELDDSKSFFETQINEQDSFIDFKVGDYPYLQPQCDSLKNLKLELDKLINQSIIKQKDSASVRKLKIKIERKSKKNLDFNSLNITTKIEDKLFSKIVKLDMIKAKYALNKNFISRKCNLVQ